MKAENIFKAAVVYENYNRFIEWNTDTSQKTLRKKKEFERELEKLGVELWPKHRDLKYSQLD